MIPSAEAVRAVSGKEQIILSEKKEGYLSKDRQTRIEQIMDKIKVLDDDKALELAKNPPVDSEDANKIISLKDPKDLRFSDAAAAKDFLEFIVIYGRSDEELNDWEAALK